MEKSKSKNSEIRIPKKNDKYFKNGRKKDLLGELVKKRGYKQKRKFFCF